MNTLPLLASCLMTIALGAADLAPALVATCDKPVLFAYGTWEGKVTNAGNRLVVRDVGSQGGAGWNQDFNLSSNPQLEPVLRLRTLPGNQAKTILLILKDGGGRSGRWSYDLPATSEAPVGVRPSSKRPLARPDASEGGDLQLAAVTQWQICGDWSASNVQLEVEGFALLPAGH